MTLPKSHAQETEQKKSPQQKPEPAYPSDLEEITRQKLKQEEHETAGRHKNVGQKDHKGAR